MCYLNTPPFGYHFKCFDKVPTAYDDSHLIKHRIVCLSLFGQASECVAVTFDFKSMQNTIYNGDIYPCRAVP